MFCIGRNVFCIDRGVFCKRLSAQMWLFSSWATRDQVRNLQEAHHKITYGSISAVIITKNELLFLYLFFIADIPLVEFMYLVFTRMPSESYCRRLGSLLLYLCYVFRALINSLVC